MRRRLVVAAAVVAAVAVVAVAVVVGLDWWRDSRRSDLERAVAMAPEQTQRYSWTDWAGVRREAGAELDASSSARDLAGFLDDAFDLDLASTSALVESAPTLHTEYGFSPATVEWELFSQSERGAVVMLRLAEDADLDRIGTRLERLGYAPPSEDDGVWYGGPEVLARIGGVTPELQYVVLDAERGLLLASDTAGYAGEAADALDSSAEVAEGVSDVVAASGEPLAAAVYTGRHACGALAMGQADANDQQLAEELVAEAGEVHPLSGFAMSVQPDGGVRVSLGFESEEQARTNADTRSVLARGPAVGQGGDFADRFHIEEVTAQDRVVTLRLEPVEGAFVLSDLSSGPVLFATC